MVSGIGGFLMAAGTRVFPYVPYSQVGTLFHILTSSMLIGGGIDYCMETLPLGAEVSDKTLLYIVCALQI